MDVNDGRFAGPCDVGNEGFGDFSEDNKECQIRRVFVSQWVVQRY